MKKTFLILLSFFLIQVTFAKNKINFIPIEKQIIEGNINTKITGIKGYSEEYLTFDKDSASFFLIIRIFFGGKFDYYVKHNNIINIKDAYENIVATLVKPSALSSGEYYYKLNLFILG